MKISRLSRKTAKYSMKESQFANPMTIGLSNLIISLRSHESDFTALLLNETFRDNKKTNNKPPNK